MDINISDKELNQTIIEELQTQFEIGSNQYFNETDKKSYSAGIGIGQMIGAFLILYELKKKYGLKIDLLDNS